MGIIRSVKKGWGLNLDAQSSSASVHSAIYPSLTGRRVIVSGGGSGIGEAMVEAFVRQGAAVGFVDIQQSASEQLIRRLADAEIAPHFLPCDITDCDDYVDKIGQLINRLGGCTSCSSKLIEGGIVDLGANQRGSTFGYQHGPRSDRPK